MAIKCIGQEWCPDAKDYLKVYVCDTDADLANLPPAPYGSTVIVAESGKTAVVNASGQWIDTDSGDVIPGAGISGGNSGSSGDDTGDSGGSGVSHWDDLDGRPFYDTRKYNTTGETLTANHYWQGLYKISDDVDMDVSKIVEVTISVEGLGVLYDHLKINGVEAYDYEYSGHIRLRRLMEASGDGFYTDISFIPTQEDAEKVWRQFGFDENWNQLPAEQNPFTPGLYVGLYSLYDSNEYATTHSIAYEFVSLESGELVPIEPELMKALVFHGEYDNNLSAYSFNGQENYILELCARGVPVVLQCGSNVYHMMDASGIFGYFQFEPGVLYVSGMLVGWRDINGEQKLNYEVRTAYPERKKNDFTIELSNDMASFGSNDQLSFSPGDCRDLFRAYNASEPITVHIYSKGYQYYPLLYIDDYGDSGGPQIRLHTEAGTITFWTDGRYNVEPSSN